ncbi:MAG: hypothetical protein ABR548_01895 [Actinomycetota bacterium]|nr:hypothetical protein [Actinomycetota bacterium]
MTFTVIYDVAASWERYAPVAAAVSEPCPPGLVVLTAGPTDEGVRIISIWEDEVSWRRFQLQRLWPAVAELLGPPAPPPVERYLRSALFAPGELTDAVGGWC